MSLLEEHIATVYPEQPADTDSYGNIVTRPAAQGVEVRCRITEISERQRALWGTNQPVVRAEWMFMARDAPLGHWSRVQFDGKTFTVVDGPRTVGPLGSEVRHIEARLLQER